MLCGKKILGIFTTKVNTPSSNMLITKLDANLRDYGYRVFVYSSCSELASNSPTEIGEKSVYELMDFNVIDVLVVLYEKIKDRELSARKVAEAKAHGIPVFVLGGYIEGCYNLRFDYREGMSEITRHVIERHNARKLHFIAGFEGNAFSEERIEAFKEVIVEHNMPFDESMVSYGDFWSEPTKAAVQKIIDSGDMPDAIICANDTMAVAACSVLKDRGFKIPDDVIVTGFDGILDVKISDPTITTSTCSNNELADIISQILIEEDIINAGARDYDVTPRLTLAQSCGCVKESNINTSAHLTMLNDRFNRYQSEEHELFQMSAKMLTCSTLQQICDLMEHVGFFEIVCVLRKECIDETVNPLTVPDDRDKENMFVVYDTDDYQRFKPCEIKCSDIIPNLERQLELGDPLIFVALNFLHVPLGYVCFHYHNYDMENYYRIPQTVNILSNALGSFRTMRYQHYLTTKMEEIYKRDRLTGLYNRNALVNTYEELEDRLRNGSKNITFILSDLDRLKYINDTFGHVEGDYAIRAVADALKLAVPPNALLARWGGDEMFAVIQGDCDEQLIRRTITEYLSAVSRSQNKPYEITASVGMITSAPGDLPQLDDVTKAVDRLMYADKMSRRKARVD